MTIRFTLVVLIAGLVPARAEAQVIDEYQVKAAFLFNFAKFVEWPATAFKSADEPIGICVLGLNPFGSSLEDAVRGKTVGSRSFLVREVSNGQQASKCHIVFVSSSERKRLRFILQDLQANGILTVGEMEGFATEGGVINFKLEGGSVRLEINVDAAEQQRLQISSKLLSLAGIVRGEGKAGANSYKVSKSPH